MAAADVSEAHVEQAQSVKNSTVLIPPDGMHRPACRLVYDDFLVVFKQNRQRPGQRLLSGLETTKQSKPPP